MVGLDKFPHDLGNAIENLTIHKSSSYVGKEQSPYILYALK